MNERWRETRDGASYISNETSGVGGGVGWIGNAFFFKKKKQK